MKYIPEVVDKICDLLSSGDYTIKDVCRQVGINEDTYHTWKKEKPDFSEAIKKAEIARLDSFAKMAKSGLAKLLDVYEYEEVTTEYVDSKGKDDNGNEVSKPKIKSRKVVKKFIMPNPTAVIFALKNRDPDNWADKQEVDVKTNGESLNKKADLSKLTDEELRVRAEIDRKIYES